MKYNGVLRSAGEPLAENYTNYEFVKIMNNLDLRAKTIFYRNGIPVSVK